MSGEVWASVAGWEGLYEVSDLGRVRSLPRLVPHWRGGLARRPARIMRTSIDKDGYRTVCLSRPSTRQTVKVHRLVALAFLGDPPPSKPLCLHIDGDPQNNRLSNLRWGSHSENEQDKLRHGTHQEASKTRCPQGHPYSAENTYTPPGTNYRQCHTCRAAHTAKSNQSRAEARARARGVAA